MNRITAMLREFSKMSLLFVATVFVERAVELMMAWSGGIKIESYNGFLWANLVACGCQIFVVFIVLAAFYFISKKVAKALALLLFAILAFTEMGFVIYHHSTGLMMGQEMVYRPLWETLFTIRSFLSPALILLILVVFAAYIAFMDWYSRKQSDRTLSYVTICLMVLSVPVVLMAKPSQDEYVANKIWYCVDDMLSVKQVEVKNVNNNDKFSYKRKQHDDYLEIYRQMFPNRQSIDNEYVLERYDNIENVLGPYFEKSEEKVDIVMIIVESLGTDLFGINDYGVCYTPFLDSLSRSSLLWTNCLSTTPRSFGAVPSITGSVPHGLRGFQFGDIPNHNSLCTILKANGYRTNVFYSGLFTFDKVYDYLVAQKVDYMSPFYEEFQEDENVERDGGFWGYNDMTMFEKSLQVIENLEEKPELDLFITITQHEKLSLKDKKLNDFYYGEAKKLISNLPKSVRKVEKGNIGKLAATLYADDAVRRFFKSYNELHPEGNTIFVITGDHNMGLKKDSYLDAYKVPLIIWSPLLKQSKQFKSLVSHDDITPSLVALLRDNFGMQTPETVHWMSDGLDTLSDVVSDYKGYLMSYSKYCDLVYDGYFVTYRNGKAEAFKIGDSLTLTKMEDVDYEEFRDYYEALVYVDNYVYQNNKITKNPIVLASDFELVKETRLEDSVYCASDKHMPSVHKPDTLVFYKDEFKGVDSEIKVVVTADIMFTKKVPIDHFINIGIRCKGDDMIGNEFMDYISKYIKNIDYQADRWEKLEVSTMISVNNSKKVELEIYLLPAIWDSFWDPEHTVTLKNVVVRVLD